MSCICSLVCFAKPYASYIGQGHIPRASCLQADIKAKEDADHASQIDPKKAAILLAAGLTVRYYLLDIVKIMIILAILLGDASFVAVLYVR